MMTSNVNTLAAKMALLVLLFWSALSQIALPADLQERCASEESITLLTDFAKDVEATPFIPPGKGHTDVASNFSCAHDFKHRKRVDEIKTSIITICQNVKFLEFRYNCQLHRKLIRHFGAGERIIPEACVV